MNLFWHEIFKLENIYIYIFIRVAYIYKKLENEVFNPNEWGHAIANQSMKATPTVQTVRTDPSKNKK